MAYTWNKSEMGDMILEVLKKSLSLLRSKLWLKFSWSSNEDHVGEKISRQNIFK